MGPEGQRLTGGHRTGDTSARLNVLELFTPKSSVKTDLMSENTDEINKQGSGGITFPPYVPFFIGVSLNKDFSGVLNQ